jgi:uncharacterized Ntn-hydrolase superfamily protein
MPGARARLLLLSLLLALLPAPAFTEPGSPSRPVSTYSIVARDAATGELGVAVQSHWFSVGPIVPWAESGVGAVATQSFVRVAYGPLGLEAMRRGESPDSALKALLEADPGREVRQVAMVDAHGSVAAHTGSRCIPGAGHRIGDGYSVQANLMLTDEVPAAMAEAFESAEGPLAERMLAALQAAQRVGGDIRGKQSAALLVVRAQPSREPWNDRVVDLRVEDHAKPLAELGRLLRLHRAYELMNRGDEAMAAGEMDRALVLYADAETMFPDNDEFIFWHAVTLVNNERADAALPLFARSFRMNPAWMLVVPRLIEKGHLPDDEGLSERILGAGPK